MEASAAFWDLFVYALRNAALGIVYSVRNTTIFYDPNI